MKSPAVVAALSGGSALIFENLWFRSASIALGNSATAGAVVLSAFMAGIALGSVGWLRFEPRIRRPMKAYAAIEMVIASSGILALLLLPRVTVWLTPAFTELTAAPFSMNALRLAVAFTLLLVPAAAMGATLPVLMQAVSGAPDTFGGKLGRVYGVNTLGAVAGTLGAELFLIPAIGVFASGMTAASLNVLAAALAMRAAYPALSRQGASRAARSARKSQTVTRRWPLLVAGALSGALFLGFEVATFRFLLLFFTALDINFALMLAVILCGLALGGLAAGWWCRRRTSAANTIIGGACVASVALVCSYRLFATWLAAALTLSPLAAVAVATVAFALPLSVLSGFLFAAIGQALHQTGLREGVATGILTAVNTIGGAVGALVTGVFLIEGVGLETCFLICAAGYGLIGVLAVASTAGSARAEQRRAQWAGAVLFSGGLLLFPTGLMDRVFHRFPVNQLSAAGETRVALREGRGETLQYLRSDSLGRPDYYRLVTNNHSMAATDVRSRRYMRLFAHLPSILHPRPESAALLGLGLGVTARALTEDARLSSIEVVDISPDVAAMLPVLYPSAADNPLSDPRVRLHVEDGRFFLATTGRRFDVITAEPPPPHYAGVAHLYSQEFFTLLAERLNPGGIATYWLPVHDLKLDEARSIVAAFLAAFPETALWSGAGLDWILMGVKPPAGGITDEGFRTWWTRPPVSDGLREIGVDRPEGLGALFLADGARLREWVGSALPLTDDFPRRISVNIPRNASDSAAFIGFMLADERPVNFQSSPLVHSLWPPGVHAATLSHFARQARVDALLSLPALDVKALRRILGVAPDPLLVKALFWRHYFDFDRAHALLAAESERDEVGVAEYRAQVALMHNRPSEAAAWLSRSRSPRARELQTIRAYCLSLADTARIEGDNHSAGTH